MSVKVIKASAGSGKTYRLTNDYIDLLKKSSHNQILAVTFTNKATEEMKSRIVKTLNELATEKNNKEAEDFRNKILHDYSHFNVSTIDKFFQKIVRSMFRELGFSGLYNLVIDNKQVINDSVDELRIDLEKFENIYKLLYSIAIGKLKEGKDWSFSEVLKSLTVLLWKEEFMNLTKEEVDLYTYEHINNFYEECKEKKRNIAEKLSELAEEAKKSFTSIGLTLENSKNKTLTKLDSFIEKKVICLTNSQFEKLSLENALTKDNYKKYSSDLIQSGFDKNIDNFAKAYSENIKLYNTIDVVISYATYLPVIVEINKLIRDRLKDRNEFLLSDINHLLASMIGDNDAPFIYEKVGTQIKNYLLDEFQDTSSMQWKNFIPLIDESVSNGDESLVVGDVKQSIYRWRNSDWNILGSKIKDRYDVNCLEEQLKCNWRSKTNIVTFNNAFFSNLVKVLDNDEGNEKSENGAIISAIYSDVKQEISPDRKFSEGGYVNVKVWKKQQGKSVDLRLKELEAIYNDIQEVLSHGYELKDIAILVRYNNYGVEISKYLLEKGINVISSESLLVSSSDNVKLLVHLLKMSIKADTEVNKLELENLRTFTEEDQKEILEASNLPLFEQVERYIQILGLKEKSIVYIQAFQDIVFNYNQKYSSDINGFLSWWESEGSKMSIEGSSGVNAVNVLTIHKSKGLDFPVVLVPNCEWPLGFNDEIMWFKDNTNLFENKLPLVPLKVVKALENTIFSEEYKKEMLYRKIDNLNLLYVAFTRPRNALYIYSAPVGNQNGIYKWLENVLQNISLDINSENEEDDEIKTYSFGELLNKEDDKEIKKEEEKSKKENICDCSYSSVNYRNKVKFNFQTETSLIQHKGNVLHGILQNIKTSKDAPKAINKAIRMGIISNKEKEYVEGELNKIFKNTQTSSWFDGTYTKIWNERTIISNELSRPDRIMEKDGELLVVDYKFGKENDEYKAQLRGYIKLLESMKKWNSIKGCIYYHMAEKVEWIN